MRCRSRQYSDKNSYLDLSMAFSGLGLGFLEDPHPVSFQSYREGKIRGIVPIGSSERELEEKVHGLAKRVLRAKRPIRERERIVNVELAIQVQIDLVRVPVHRPNVKFVKPPRG